MSGTLYPLFLSSFLILRRFSASNLPGAVILTYSHPASTIRIDCSTVAIVFIVSVVVIDCIRIGLPAPKGISPTKTSWVLYLEFFVKLLQYVLNLAIVLFIVSVYLAKIK